MATSIRAVRKTIPSTTNVMRRLTRTSTRVNPRSPGSGEADAL
jgi:hypothetical protein